MAAKSLLESIDALNQSLEEKREQRSSATLSEVEKKSIDGEIDRLNQAIAEQVANLDSVVTGLDLDAFYERDDEAVVLEREVRQLIEPLVGELRRATARPRETEQLRATLATLRRQEEMATEAVAHLTNLLKQAEDPAVKAALESKLSQWKEKLNQATNRLSVAEFQLEERLSKEQSVFGTVRGAFSSFFRTRGRNALGAIALGLATFIVLRSDGFLGNGIKQTPEWVQLVLLGSSRKNYVTSDFLGLAPQNLSTGFRLHGIFCVDYQHQGASTFEIPQKMKACVEKGFAEIVKDDELVHLKIELAEAAASSLNYAVIADISGSAAAKYRTLERALQRLCVEACNTHGWTIPFTQITVHQAAAPSPS